jgi:integrase/recombinase XerD
VTRDVIREYQTFLYYFERAGKKLSFGTQHSKLTAVKSFFRFLVKEEYLPYDPSSAIELPKRRKNLPRGIMSIREVVKVLETPSGSDPLSLRDRAILEVLYCTGIRNTELRCLTLFDVDVPDHHLRVRYAKGKKERIVPLGEIALRHLTRYLNEGRPHIVRERPSQNLLFVSKHGNQLNTSNLIWIVKKYIKKAKIGKNITPHGFRHSCASHMLKGKADLRHIQELLGHASVHTTQIYTKVELSNLKEVHKRCHPREKKGSPR